MIKDLLIISPTKGKEINPLGDKINKNKFPKGASAEFRLYKIAWQEAEDKLKEYTITNSKVLFRGTKTALQIINGSVYSCAWVGATKKCKVNEETGEAVIL